MDVKENVIVKNGLKVSLRLSGLKPLTSLTMTNVCKKPPTYLPETT